MDFSYRKIVGNFFEIHFKYGNITSHSISDNKLELIIDKSKLFYSIYEQKEILNKYPINKNKIKFTFNKEIKQKEKKIIFHKMVKCFYQFCKYKKECENMVIYLDKKDISEEDINIEKNRIIVRDLENEPTNTLLIRDFVKVFQNLPNTKVNLIDTKKQKLNLIQAVGGGSNQIPVLVVVEYIQNNKYPTINLTGKGIMFDSGGLSIKSAYDMTSMHTDKTGACVVYGLLKHIIEHKYKVNLLGFIPLAENSISHKSTRPGDIIKSYSGQTVEINDTDAEGRLILADALAYANKHYDFDFTMIFSTITGFGEDIHFDIDAMIMTPQKTIKHKLEDLGDNVGERVWGLPPWIEYNGITEGTRSDLKNYDHGNGIWEMTDPYIVNLFLSKFMKNNKWVHFDIANNYQNNLAEGNSFLIALEFIKTII